MAIINHLNKYTIDTDIANSYKRAAMYLLYGAMAKVKPILSYTEYPAGNSQIRDWAKLCQDRIIEPSAQRLSHVDNDEDVFNMYLMSFDDEKNHLIADILYLENKTDLCILSIDNNNEAIVDLMSTSIHNMQQDQISISYMYFSAVQQFLTLVGEKDFLDKVHSQQYDGATLDPHDIGGQ